LEQYERFLVVLEKTDEDRKAKSKQIGEAMVKLENEIKDYLSKSMNNKSKAGLLISDEMKMYYRRLTVS